MFKDFESMCLNDTQAAVKHNELGTSLFLCTVRQYNVITLGAIFISTGCVLVKLKYQKHVLS
jgi:hypothetical protein